MATSFIGTHIAIYETEEDLLNIKTTPSRCDAKIEPNVGLFLQSGMQKYASVAQLAAAAPGLRLPFPKFVPGDTRSLGYFLMRDADAEPCDVVFPFIEHGIQTQPLHLGERPLVPDDAALTVYWSRRVGSPLPVRVVADEETDRLSRLITATPAAVSIDGAVPAVMLRWAAAEGGVPLRERRIPAEAIIWYSDAYKGWISVHSNLATGVAERVASSIESSDGREA